MTRSSVLLPWLPWLLLLSSCGSPPKPPSVDESRRRPVNTPAAVELQSCRSDLENARILVKEGARSAEAGSLATARVVQQQQSLVRAAEANATAGRNLLVPVLFAFGSTHLHVTEVTSARILDEARAAPLVMVRGRTDGASESPVEGSVARQRAAAAEAWLVRAGVDRARIRTTWQPVGDHAADNGTVGGRTLNRRVEIEIYRAAPLVVEAGLTRGPASN